MPELPIVLAAIAAGALSGGAVMLAQPDGPGAEVGQWMAQVVGRAGAASLVPTLRGRLARDMGRAGWRESPGRVELKVAAVVLCLALFGSAVSPVVGILALMGGCAGFAYVLHASIERRRRRSLGELVPLLELFTLELSGGGSALSALGSVCVQVESELATDLRRLLIASQVAGSPSFEARLVGYAEEHELAALSSLATILAASRDFGSAAGQGVRALAADLRRAQRRELIAQSRKALNNVLLPAGIAVLLPFLGVLMFPAVSVLQRSLR